MSQPADLLMQQVDWKPIIAPTIADAHLPHVTHTGVLRIANLEIECFQLSNGKRVISEDGMKTFLKALGIDK